MVEQSLTTVDTDGGKLETQVYAGGALIARQDSRATTTMADDKVRWTAADPVTGTVAAYSSGTGFVTEESEPLGQRIDLSDPNPIEPESYEQHLFYASDPEWSCGISKEF